MSARLNGILQLAITAQDMGRATAFYREVLGLKFLMGDAQMAFFDCSGVRLYLTRGEGTAHDPGTGTIYFRAIDVDAQCAALKAGGAAIHQEPQRIARLPDHDLWLMWIRDSEGNLLGIMEERKH